MDKIIEIHNIKNVLQRDTQIINVNNVKSFKFIRNDKFYDFYIDDVFNLKSIELAQKEKIQYFLIAGKSLENNYKYETITLNVKNEKLESIRF